MEVVNLELAMLCTSSESNTDDSSSELSMDEEEASTAPPPPPPPEAEEEGAAPGGLIPGPGRRGGCLRPARWKEGRCISSVGPFCKKG